MKKEFTTALLELANTLLPVGWPSFQIHKKTRSKILYRKNPSEPDGLFYFVCIYPGNRWEELCPYIGWNLEGNEPTDLIEDARALDLRGEEYLLEDFRISLSRTTSRPGKRYEIVPSDCSFEEILLLSQPIPDAKALALVESCIQEIRKDLDQFGKPYLDWITSKRG